MQHDYESAGGHSATDSAESSGINARTEPLRRRNNGGQRLSFVTDWETSTRRRVASDYFDVHAVAGPPGASGSVLGYLMARELFEGMRTDPCVGFYDLHLVMKGAYAVSKDRDADPLRFDAASTFIIACNEMLKFAATAADHGSYLNGRIADTEAFEEACRQRKEKRTRRSVERMQRAKEAKRRGTVARQLVTEACHG